MLVVVAYNSGIVAHGTGAGHPLVKLQVDVLQLGCMLWRVTARPTWWWLISGCVYLWASSAACTTSSGHWFTGSCELYPGNKHLLKATGALAVPQMPHSLKVYTLSSTPFDCLPVTWGVGTISEQCFYFISYSAHFKSVLKIVFAAVCRWDEVIDLCLSRKAG